MDCERSCIDGRSATAAKLDRDLGGEGDDERPPPDEYNGSVMERRAAEPRRARRDGRVSDRRLERQPFGHVDDVRVDLVEPPRGLDEAEGRIRQQLRGRLGAPRFLGDEIDGHAEAANGQLEPDLRLVHPPDEAMEPPRGLEGLTRREPGGRVNDNSGRLDPGHRRVDGSTSTP